jgi:hypothetical protein
MCNLGQFRLKCHVSLFQVDPCERCNKNITRCNKACYFGSCGLDGTCQCKEGYSGDQCEKRRSTHFCLNSIDASVSEHKLERVVISFCLLLCETLPHHLLSF